MKILFLDLDGVLVTEKSASEQIADWDAGIEKRRFLVDRFEKVCVERLNQITSKSGAKIVISSSWRHMHNKPALKRILADGGVTGEIVDVTPPMMVRRGLEIQAWLQKHPEVEAFVILDDMEPEEFPGLESKHVWTSWQKGIEERHTIEALKILGSGLAEAA